MKRKCLRGLLLLGLLAIPVSAMIEARMEKAKEVERLQNELDAVSRMNSVSTLLSLFRR